MARTAPFRISFLLTSLKPTFVGLGCCVTALAAIALPSMPSYAQTLSEKVVAMERGLEQEFETYFGEDLAEVTQTPEAIAQTLERLSAETNTRSAVLWAIPRGDHLHLVLITPGNEPIVRDLYEVSDDDLRATVEAFALEVSSASQLSTRPASRQLHQWLIEPFEADYLEAEGIDTILFCLGNGLRGVPLAALYDGESFLIERYSLTRIPAFNLIQTDYTRLNAAQFLAMGASEFQELSPLPAVPTELNRVLWELSYARPPEDRWQGGLFLNQQFTADRLHQLIERRSPNIVHLATHAIFQPGAAANSYIQLWDQPLMLDDMDDIGWDIPALELLVLSACQTAIGNDEAELGFAGLALKSGVKSVLASSWNISDAGTLALMSEFYRQLGLTSTKAEALRQAQIRLLKGDVRFEGNRLVLSRNGVPIAVDLDEATIPQTLSSPYYWAGFTLISSPW